MAIPLFTRISWLTKNEVRVMQLGIYTLSMFVDDFDDFMVEPHSARRAVHCAITAHHLLDGGLA